MQQINFMVVKAIPKNRLLHVCGINYHQYNKISEKNRHFVSGGFYCGMGDIGFIYNMDFNRNMKKKNKLKRKATNSLKQVVYMAIWNEEVPKKCKKIKCYEN